MGPYCPICDNATCSCKWSLDELYESWRLDSDSDIYGRQTGSVCHSDDSTDGCVGLPVFSSSFANIGLPSANSYSSGYKSIIVDVASIKIGDLVHYYPLWGMADWEKLWLVKEVFSLDPLDCAFYDYEITDGLTTHLVSYYEIAKWEKK